MFPPDHKKEDIVRFQKNVKQNNMANILTFPFRLLMNLLKIQLLKRSNGQGRVQWQIRFKKPPNIGLFDGQ